MIIKVGLLNFTKMFQDVLIYIILSVAAGIALYRMARFLINPFRKCDGCGSNCHGCALDDLKKELAVKKKTGVAETIKKG